MGSEGLSSEDHRKAAEELRMMLRARGYERNQGADRLENLLRFKGRVAYAPEGSSPDFNHIVQQAERFAAWAEAAGKSLKIEGWRND